MLMLIEEWIIKPRISFTVTHNLTCTCNTCNLMYTTIPWVR